MAEEKKGAKFYKKTLTKWLKDDENNSQQIELVDTDKKKHKFNFTIGAEELNFSIRYPYKEGDKWKVESADLSTEFAKAATKRARKKKNISDVLSICVEEFAALDDGEDFFDDEEFDEEDYGDEDGFMFEEPAPKKKDTGPEIDTSIFSIPTGYEGSCVQAILQEYKTIVRLPEKERLFDAQPLNNNIGEWEIKLRGFPADEPLSADMKSMGLDHILLRVMFPPNYPFYPPFLRVISPRFAFHTGHVTIGGAICTHVLTNEGWIATYRLPQILVDVRAMMISGKGRLDKSNRSPYSEQEALQALRRLLSTHGWKHWKA
eukprot:TRINITY_DN20430_c0_g1_i1.p1 TRINITY_DN20430_c0_g1~~TRINITY_DN20430_c0_g1_i1.p1  ORF type:complete len:340 (+),score=84.07 TRINITY_DN20430_c0_g1_i1:69-1022(+)